MTKNFIYIYIYRYNKKKYSTSHLIMSDEAHFPLSGYVKKQNCSYWSAENTRIILS